MGGGTQDSNTKESRGFAFVRFFDQRDAEVRPGRRPSHRRRVLAHTITRHVYGENTARKPRSDGGVSKSWGSC